VLLGTALVILGSHLPRVEAHYGVLGTGFALWVLAAAQFSSSVWVQRARPLALIGDWSYAIYLLHVPVITIFLSQFRDGRTAESLFLTTVVLALCVGGICGALEVRLHRKIKGWTRVRTLQRGMALETSATS
jgi:peptidoglycan/LPS O-acetylase OafA/YrhL